MAGDGATAAAFATDPIFHAIRLEPYLLATAERHPDLAPALNDLAEATAATRETLVHGDVQPEEHPRRTPGSRFPRRRMRLVRGPRLRHRLLA